MSTQTRFDFAGLIEAIEASNSAYQVALYAEHAEVQIADGDSVGQAPRVLMGRPAIARWIEGMAARRIVHRIVDLRADRWSVSFVDELQDPDGTTTIHRRTAEICTGQISLESVTVEAKVRCTESGFERWQNAPAVMTDEDPGQRPRSWTPPIRQPDRHLAGNFLG